MNFLMIRFNQQQINQLKKIADTESKYGKNSYVADRARNQKKEF